MGEGGGTGSDHRKRDSFESLSPTLWPVAGAMHSVHAVTGAVVWQGLVEIVI